VAALALLAGAALASPLLDAKDIVIEGTRRVPEAYVRDTLGLNRPVNLFSFSAGGAAKALANNQYIKTVTVQKNFLAKTLTLHIAERELSCYVEMVSGRYLYLDDEGRVLQVETFYTEKLPFVVGLNFSGFTLGQPLAVENPEGLAAAVTLSRITRSYGMGEERMRIDVSADTPRLLVRNVDVDLGSLKDIDEKIQALLVILENLPDKNMKGTLDMRDMSKPPRFTILT
jgi:cell division septal protein FtsQ